MVTTSIWSFFTADDLAKQYCQAISKDINIVIEFSVKRLKSYVLTSPFVTTFLYEFEANSLRYFGMPLRSLDLEHVRAHRTAFLMYAAAVL